MNPRLYVETTVVSYLAARASRDIVVAAHQQITQEWWSTRRSSYDLVISELVRREVAGGDSAAAAQRTSIIQSLPVLETTDFARTLAHALLVKQIVPATAVEDALHIALAAAHGCSYLLTWNCRHIANAAIRDRIAMACRETGVEPPIICTPEELMQD